MNAFSLIWNSIFYHPIVNLILFLYKYTGHNLGVAIVILTVIIRLALWPFMKSQVAYMKKMNDVKPQLDALKSKYGSDKRAFQEAQLKFFRENGVNPAGSCLPLLIQLPFIYAVYNVIRAASTATSATVFNNIAYTKTLALPAHSHFQTSFLGVNLAKDAASIGFHNISALLPYIITALLVGATQYYASKVSLPANTAQTTEAVEIIEEKQPKDTLDPEQFSKALSNQMLYILPIFLVWISWTIPSGLSIYWIVQSLCIVLQTIILQRI